jgi:hypothetical protein
MKNKIIESIINKMDHIDLINRFSALCAEGLNTHGMMKFLEYAIPCYEKKKKQFISDMINNAAYSIIDSVMEDPLNNQLNGYLSQLKQIANELNIKIDALNK